MNQVRYADTFSVRVTERHVGVVATDGAHFGRLWFGRTDDFADERDTFDAFEDDGDNGSGHHVSNVIVESLFATAGNHLTDVFVMSAIVIFGRFDHFHTNDFETDAFEALEDFAGEAALNGIWFKDD